MEDADLARRLEGRAGGEAEVEDVVGGDVVRRCEVIEDGKRLAPHEQDQLARAPLDEAAVFDGHDGGHIEPAEPVDLRDDAPHGGLEPCTDLAVVKPILAQGGEVGLAAGQADNLDAAG